MHGSTRYNFAIMDHNGLSVCARNLNCNMWIGEDAGLVIAMLAMRDLFLIMPFSKPSPGPINFHNCALQ